MYAKHCNMVKELHIVLYAHQTTTQELPHLCAFFDRVQKLRLQYTGSCRHYSNGRHITHLDLSALFTSNSVVEDLRLCGQDKGYSMDLPTVHLSKLKCLWMDHVVVEDDASTSTFFSLNPQLVALSSKSTPLNNKHGKIFKYLPNLQMLEWSHMQRIKDSRARFEHLKVLSISLTESDIMHTFLKRLAKERVSLEYLVLFDNKTNSSRIIDSVCRIPSLKYLHIHNHTIDDDCLIRFARHLNRLEDINFKKGYNHHITTSGVRDFLENVGVCLKQANIDLYMAPDQKSIIERIAEQRNIQLSWTYFCKLISFFQ